MFAKTKFLRSAGHPDQFPSLKDKQGKPVGEIAIVGRSNVGKSSLINHLTQNQNLAHVSSSPGKTRAINFFTVDESLLLVDLPGYGYAKVAKKIQEGWGDLIQGYLEKRQSLRLILLLSDLRHPPTPADLAFAEWAIHFEKPLLIVFTKADKLAPGAVQGQMAKHFSHFFAKLGQRPVGYAAYSIRSGTFRAMLTNEIKRVVC